MAKQQHLPFLIGLVIYELCIYLSSDAFLPALPDLAHTFSIQILTAQYAITAWFIGSALLPLVMGPVSEYFGYRRTLLFSAIIFLCSSIVCAYAPSFHLFLIARLVQGSCVSMAITPGYATVHHLFNQHQAIITTAWMGAVTVLAAAFGPLCGAIILLFTHWPMIFIILGAISFGALCLLWRSTPTLKKSHDYNHSWRALYQSYRSILCNRLYCHYQIARCFQFAILIAWITTSPILLMKTFGFSQLQFACAQLLVFGLFVIGTKCVKMTLQHIQPEQLLTYALSLCLLFGALTVVAALLAPHQSWYFTSGIAGIGFCVGLGAATINRLAIETTKEPMAMRMAMGGFLFSVFGVIGSASISLIRVDELLELGMIIAVFSLLAFAFFFTRPKRS